MRNLKKVLALCLAVTMAFGIAISAAAFSDDSSITHPDAVQLLTELQIIAGFPDGSFQPTGSVTRGQMAKMVYVAMRRGVDDGGTAFANATVPLTDIASHWAKGYVKYAYGAGLIAGFPNGTFQPDASVTGYQAAKMLLTSLGYSSDAQGYTGTGWDFRVGVDAASAGLLDDIDGIDLSAPLSRDNAAQMIYNTIFATMVYYDEGTLTDRTYTFAENKLNLKELEGILVATDEAGFEGPAADGKVTIALGTDNNDPITVDTHDDVSFNGKVTMDGTADVSLIGQDVTAYAKIKTQDSNGNITAYDKVYGKVVAKIGENNVFTVRKWDSTPDPDGKYTVSDGTLFSQNYGTLEPKDAADIGTAIKKGDNVIYISNDNNKSIDIVVDVQYYYDDKVSIKSDDTIKFDKLMDDYEDLDDVHGADQLENGDRAIGWQYDGGDYYVQAVTSFDGKLTGTTSDNPAKAKISGSTYESSNIIGTKVDSGDDDNSDITKSENVNKTLTYYTDGKYIVDFEKSSSSQPDKYCGIRDVSSGSGVVSDDKAAVTLQDGTDATYVINDYEDLNGDDETDSDDLDLYAGKIATYTINSSGEINLGATVDLPGTLASNYTGGNSIIKLGNKNYIFDASSVIFNRVTKTGYYDFDVAVGRTNTPDIDAGDVLAAAADDDNYVSAILVQNSPLEDTGNYGVLLDFSRDYNEDDDVYYTLTMYDGTEVKDYVTDTDPNIRNAADTSNDSLSAGDVLKFTLDGDEISDVYVQDIHLNADLGSFDPDDNGADGEGFYAGFVTDYEAGSYVTIANYNNHESLTLQVEDEDIVDLVDYDTVAGDTIDTGDSVNPVVDEDDLDGHTYGSGDYNTIVRVKWDADDDCYYVSNIYYFSELLD